MRLDVSVDSALPAEMEREIDAIKKAVTGGIRSVAEKLQKEWRSQITGAGLGERLARTIRKNDYPSGSGRSIGAASLVYARKNSKKTASAADVVDAFNRGVTIRSTDGFFLAIPLPASGGNFGTGRKRLTPYLWEQRTGMRLRFVYRRGRPSLLVADDARIGGAGRAGRKGGRRRKDGILSGAQTVPIFILVPQVRLKKRLDLDRATKAAEGALVGAILSRWPET